MVIMTAAFPSPIRLRLSLPLRTATGVHAAALIKAFRKNDLELANAVYSGVPAHLFGLDQVIEIGPMSGKSNVLFWLEKHRIPADDATVTRIFDAAKTSASESTRGIERKTLL